MPHLTTDFERPARSMASSNSAFSPISTSRTAGNVSALSTPIDNKWRRASLPISEIHSDMNGGRARSGSIISTASNMTQTRRTAHHDHLYGSSTSRERVLRDSPLIAELRTNVIIKDEYTLVTDLSYNLAIRYSKPDSSIMINVDHSSCLALGGTFDPCYILTLTTTSLSFSADTNKRNAALIQAFMADILSVPPDRGIVRFNAISEENYAINSNTIYGELERLEHGSGAESVRRMPMERKSGHMRRVADEHKANGVTSDKEHRAARRRSTINENSGEVFELAADSDGRPSTGATNPIDGSARSQTNSRENLKNEGTRTQRPKTLATQPNGSAAPDTFADAKAQSKPKHVSTVIKAEQKSAHMPASAKSPRPINTAPNRTHSSGTRSLTSAALTPVTLKETIVDNPKILKADAKYDSDNAPNTAKRRSTFTATPKLPAPPPVPESKTPKVSKRKSFLAAFRR